MNRQQLEATVSAALSPLEERLAALEQRQTINKRARLQQVAQEIDALIDRIERLEKNAGASRKPRQSNGHWLGEL